MHHSNFHVSRLSVTATDDEKYEISACMTVIIHLSLSLIICAEAKMGALAMLKRG